MNKRTVPVKVGDRTFNLRYNFDSLTTIEDQLGKPFLEVFVSLTKLSFTAVKVVFWAGLKQNHSDITLDEVGAILNECEDLPAMIKALTDAVGNFMSKAKAVPEKKETTAKKASTKATGV
jgi:hypothetical protein